MTIKAFVWQHKRLYSISFKRNGCNIICIFYNYIKITPIFRLFIYRQ